MILPFDESVPARGLGDGSVRPLPRRAQRLTPLAPGSRHQREKLAVLFAFSHQALQARPGFDAGPALDALFTHAQAEHPQHWSWQGGCATAGALGLAVADGQVRTLGRGSFGLGDELPRCVAAQAPAWRAAALFALSFAEDLAVLDGTPPCPAWLCATLPSHWAPEAAIDRPAAWSEGLVEPPRGGGADGVERWLWSLDDHPRLHAHPLRADPARWVERDLHGVPRAWLRRERRIALPLPASGQWLLTLAVDLQPVHALAADRTQAARLADALRSQAAPDALPVREPLLALLGRALQP